MLALFAIATAFGAWIGTGLLARRRRDLRAALMTFAASISIFAVAVVTTEWAERAVSPLWPA